MNSFFSICSRQFHYLLGAIIFSSQLHSVLFAVISSKEEPETQEAMTQLNNFAASYPIVFRIDDHNQGFLNFYTENSSIRFRNLDVVKTEKNLLMDVLKELTARDHQSINHLLVEARVIRTNEQKQLYLTHAVLRWNVVTRELTFQHQGDETPIVNFVSRNYCEGDDLVANHKIYYLPADTHPLALYSHSEALFFGLLNQKPDLFTELLNNILLPDETIDGIVLTYYSSLDSCDNCQTLIHQFSSEWRHLSHLDSTTPTIPLHQTFFSCYPCKKSSYRIHDGNNIRRLSFNKDSQKFLMNKQPFSFRTSKNPVNLKNNSPGLISHIYSPFVNR